MDWKRIREKVLDDFYPTEEEAQETRELYERISHFIKSEFSRDTHFAGSASRRTNVRGDKDIDIFVLFPEDAERKELEEGGLKIGKAVFEKFDGDSHVEYAEHPYTRGEIEGHDVEIVPCYDVEPEDIKSSVDRTPHHSRWVEDNLDEEKRKEVVLLKSFLRSSGLYGSSLRFRGFSGYLCEVLIAEYGSFRELVSETANWSRGEVIDPEGHHDKLPNDLEKKFGDEPLRVIDPVDPERNVAAVLDAENYARFIYDCWRFRQEPGINFFREEEIEFSEFELEKEIDERGDFIVIEFETPDEVDDILYPQMRKTVHVLDRKLSKNDFRVFEKGFHPGKRTRIFFELEDELPLIQQKKGPKIFHGEEHLAQFTSKYDNVYVKGERLNAKTEREYTNARELLKDFLDSDTEKKGVPGNVAENIEEFSFINPMDGDEKWLKYLAEKLHVTSHD